ncbi:unnamed protein product [Pleuronectes platessa]|uniref:Uncharacterized protein n=1 Tax=Pleuronectes platessa TaxID=8262 RepID=A0A9N7U071_PLEPL|nr:unnamed protein product [Pleuronectes platessa]
MVSGAFRDRAGRCSSCSPVGPGSTLRGWDPPPRTSVCGRRAGVCGSVRIRSRSHAAPVHAEAERRTALFPLTSRQRAEPQPGEETLLRRRHELPAATRSSRRGSRWVFVGEAVPSLRSSSSRCQRSLFDSLGRSCGSAVVVRSACFTESRTSSRVARPALLHDPTRTVRP